MNHALRIDRERIDRERIDRERIDRERIDRERIDRERIDRERIDRERIDRRERVAYPPQLLLAPRCFASILFTVCCRNEQGIKTWVGETVTSTAPVHTRFTCATHDKPLLPRFRSGSFRVLHSTESTATKLIRALLTFFDMYDRDPAQQYVEKPVGIVEA
jgi:hypothetical protein